MLSDIGAAGSGGDRAGRPRPLVHICEAASAGDQCCVGGVEEAAEINVIAITGGRVKLEVTADDVEVSGVLADGTPTMSRSVACSPDSSTQFSSMIGSAKHPW